MITKRKYCRIIKAEKGQGLRKEKNTKKRYKVIINSKIILQILKEMFHQVVQPIIQDINSPISISTITILF